jgi:hypothetical protein
MLGHQNVSLINKGTVSQKKNSVKQVLVVYGVSKEAWGDD